MDIWEKPYVFSGAFVNIHCVRIMNVVCEKRAEGLETHAEVVKIYPLAVVFVLCRDKYVFFFRGSK